MYSIGGLGSNQSIWSLGIEKYLIPGRNFKNCLSYIYSHFVNATTSQSGEHKYYASPNSDISYHYLSGWICRVHGSEDDGEYSSKLSCTHLQYWAFFFHLGMYDSVGHLFHCCEETFLKPISNILWWVWNVHELGYIFKIIYIMTSLLYRNIIKI